MELKQWAENLLRETYEKWNSLERKYEFWKSGFAVFYSPVYESPDLMVIGFNPGGDEKSFDENVALMVPDKHDYFKWEYPYPLAKKMKDDIFGKINETELLRRSVKLNLIFFRSRIKNDFAGISKEVRKDIEQFCHEKVREIIVTLKPKIIIAEGIGTYDTLKMLLEQPPYEFNVGGGSCSLGNNGRRIFCNNDIGKKIDKNTYYGNFMFLIGLLHLSGARPAEYELNIIRESLRNDLRDYLEKVEITREVMNKRRAINNK